MGMSDNGGVPGGRIARAWYWFCGVFTAPVFREKIDLLKMQLQEKTLRVGELEKAIAKGDKEISDLKAEISKIQQELNEERRKAREFEVEFFPYRGALLRRLADGSIDKRVYCRECRRVTMTAHGRERYFCSACRIYADFGGVLGPGVMEELGG